MSPLEFETGTAKFDLLLTVRDEEQGLACLLEYSTDLFDPATVARFLERYETLLGILAAQPDLRLDEAKAKLGEADREHLAAKQKELKESRRRKLRELSLKS